MHFWKRESLTSKANKKGCLKIAKARHSEFISESPWSVTIDLQTLKQVQGDVKLAFKTAFYFSFTYLLSKREANTYRHGIVFLEGVLSS